MVAASDLSWGIVFLAGLASFLSPCVLMIVPAYLSLISGLSFSEMQQTSFTRARGRLFGSAIAFLLGFSAVIIGLFGGAIELLGQLDETWQHRLSIIFGAVTFIFALHLLGVFRITALYREWRLHPRLTRMGYAGAFIVGAAFAFGWTPCIGPQLSAVLGLSLVSDRSGLLVVYMAGLAIPFLLAAAFLNLFLKALQSATRYQRVVEIISGLLLLLIGLLLVTDQLNGFALYWKARLR